MYNSSLKHGILDDGKYKKRWSEKNWTNREYHVQKNEDVEHQYVKMYCTTKQFPLFPFCVPHKKPHGLRWSGKNYHMCFDTKIGHVKCVIRFIPCLCTQCTYKPEKPWN